MKTLEINWIRKFDKSLVLPEVVFSSVPDCGGQYYSPEKAEVEIEGKFYDLKNGLIEVSAIYPESIAGTLAHEWRHHWQFHQGVVFQDWPWQMKAGDYERAIYDYFQMPYELDALLFEYKFTKNETADEWIGILHKYRGTV